MPLQCPVWWPLGTPHTPKDQDPRRTVVMDHQLFAYSASACILFTNSLMRRNQIADLSVAFINNAHKAHTATSSFGDWGYRSLGVVWRSLWNLRAVLWLRNWLCFLCVWSDMCGRMGDSWDFWLWRFSHVEAGYWRMNVCQSVNLSVCLYINRLSIHIPVCLAVSLRIYI